MCVTTRLLPGNVWIAYKFDLLSLTTKRNKMTKLIFKTFWPSTLHRGVTASKSFNLKANKIVSIFRFCSFSKSGACQSFLSLFFEESWNSQFHIDPVELISLANSLANSNFMVALFYPITGRSKFNYAIWLLFVQLSIEDIWIQWCNAVETI